MPGPARGAGVGRSEPFRFGENEVTIDGQEVTPEIIPGNWKFGPNRAGSARTSLCPSDHSSAVRGSTTVAMTIIQSFVLLLLWAAALAYAAYRGYKIFITLLVRARTTQIIAAPRSRSSFAPPDLTGVDSR